MCAPQVAVTDPHVTTTMDNTELVSLIYALVFLCFAFPPIAFRSAGLTVEGLFASYLGSESTDFIGYHGRRTTMTLLSHAALGFGYCVLLPILLGISALSDPMLAAVGSHDASQHHHITMRTRAYCVLWLVTLVASCIASLRAYLWMRKGYERHPLALQLASYPSGFDTIARVSAEFRRMDRLVINSPDMVVVTSSWLIICRKYSVDVARLCDIDLSIVASRDFQSTSNNETQQMLSLYVTSIHPACKPFVFKLQASYLGNLQASIGSSRIRNTLQGVAIRTTREEAFLEEFREIVSSNPRAMLRSTWGGAAEQRSCMSCMEAHAEVLIQHRCGGSECEECTCPPNFCIKCLGQWFLSQQDANRPEKWLEGRSTCAICRKKYCIADVALVR